VPRRYDDAPRDLPTAVSARRRAAAIVITQMGPPQAAAILDELSDFERDSLLLEITRLGAVSALERDRVLDDFAGGINRTA
jgi:flagellar motor switch protein FliG